MKGDHLIRINSTVATAAIAALVLAVSASPSGARTFTVAACDAASGINRSWIDDSSGASTFITRQKCPALGITDGLLTRSTTLSSRSGNGEGSGWRMDAATGTSIVGVDWAGEYWTTSGGWSAGLDSSSGRVLGCGPSSSACSRRWTSGERPLARGVSRASWLRFGIRCVSSSGCQAGDGKTHPHALASAWYLRVTIDDPQAPQISLSGDALAATWVKPGVSLGTNAVDASGISSLALDRAGVPVAVLPQPCDFFRAKPCSDQSTRFTVTTEGLAEWGVTATDAAGNSQRSSRLIGIDGNAPEAPPVPEVAGGQKWRDSSHFDLSWLIPSQGLGSPIASTRVIVCPVGSADDECLLPIDVPAGEIQSVHIRLPREGDWTARLVMTDAAGNFDPGKASEPAHLRWDREVPAAPVLSAPQGWLTRDGAKASVIRPIEDLDQNGPVSGISGWAWAVGAEPGDLVNLLLGGSIPLGELPEGESEIRVRAISGSGVTSRAVAIQKVRIDESPPEVKLDAGNGNWSASAVVASVTGSDQSGLSGFGGGGRAEARVWLDSELASSSRGSSVSVTVNRDGVHVVTADVTDAAGNRSGRVAATVRIDSTAPERVQFLPQDVADPRMVRVEASDSLSGISQVQIRMRPLAGGEWTSLRCELRNGRFEAVVDDAGLSAGEWELEATATDQAGNVTSTGKTANGSAALISFPSRGASRIEARMGIGSGSAGAASVDSLPHGKGGLISGRLLGPRDVAIEAATVTLESAPMMEGARWSEVSSEMSDYAGRFSFVISPGPGRRFRVKWNGDRRATASAAEMSARVASMTTLSASPTTVRVGASSLFKGKLEGGWIPSTGKLVLVQAFIPKRGWQTFSSTRSDGDGAWHVSYRFRAAVGRVRYSIRAFVPAEAGYPFTASATPLIHVTAVG